MSILANRDAFWQTVTILPGVLPDHPDPDAELSALIQRKRSALRRLESARRELRRVDRELARFAAEQRRAGR